jgi:hypothetical protein
VEEDASSARFVNCGPKEIDATRYKRDYYVKGDADGERKRKTWCASSSKPVANRPPSVEVAVNRMKSNEAVEPIVPVTMSWIFNRNFF